MKYCILVGGGHFCKQEFLKYQQNFESLQKDCAIVAVDGGYEYIKDIAEVACVVGDFDSLGYVPQNIATIRHDPVKDHTDMALAIDYMKGKGYEDFIIFGGLGGRLDHTFANLQMAHGFCKDSKISITFVDGDCDAHFIRDVFVVKNAKEGDMFSLFAFDKCSGVSVTGAKYELYDHTLTNTFPLGVSNEFAGGECTIQVKEGVLLYIQIKKGK